MPTVTGYTQAFTDFFAGMTHGDGLFSTDVISDPSVNYDAATGKWIISILDIYMNPFSPSRLSRRRRVQ